jgi:2'-5' RNA ligase
MPEERWRCFVAVPIGEELRASLTSYVEQLRRSSLADEWRWTDPQSWHITLAFLGSISSASVPEISGRLEEVASRHTAFTVPTGGLGAFPSIRQARVLWYGLGDSEGRLAELAADVRSVIHVNEESPFRAHITLARIRGSLAGSWTAGIASFSAPPPMVKRIALVRSHLGNGPARYYILRELAL